MHASWLVWGMLAGGCAIGLIVLARGRWLQSQTLKKSVALSVVVHAVLAGIAASIGGGRPASWGGLDAGPMTMEVLAVVEPAEPAEEPSDGEPTAASAPPDLVDAAVPPADLVPLLPVVAAPAEAVPDEAAYADAAPEERPAASADVPAVYADRVGSRRAAAAAARGGSEATEEAVAAALVWLAAAQAADGRWNAVQHGAGAATGRAKHDGHAVGTRLDHGVTGLALLAFLGAGHTHESGPHARTVGRGLEFLIARQRPDGSLAGDAEFFAALYCHGIATIALGEARALTGDRALREPLERAVRFTLAHQHPATGGWRYAAGDRGDTSQLGWQVMALATARQAGIAGFDSAGGRAKAFLQSVASGRAGGLAAYRPGERASVAMTAEALYCRLLLGASADHPATREAIDLLAASPPDAARPDAYAWYYATLASFHAGGPQWDAWNARLVAALLPLQRRGSGPLAGSWDPDPVWGGHGGRVYATALSAMTLEVYYRHAPFHAPTARATAAFASGFRGITLH